jgi:hypothetical protein
MGIKKSVFLSDQTEQIIRKMSRDDDHPQWSNVINQTLAAADWVFRESLPELTPAEWQVILNAYAGTCDTLQVQPYRIASDLMDDLGLIAVDDHPNADLVKRIHGMSQAEQFAILTFVQLFWSNDWNDVPDFSEVIKRISS